MRQTAEKLKGFLMGNFEAPRTRGDLIRPRDGKVRLETWKIVIREFL